MMKFVSIFVNDASLALQVLKSLPSKGKIYNSFRFDAEVPDLFASDGPEYLKRKKAFESSFKELAIDESSKAFQEMIDVLKTHEQSGQVLNAKELFGKFALDMMCSVVYGVDLAALDQFDKRDEVLQALGTMTDAQVSTGIYVLPDVRKVSADELQSAKFVWKDFLFKLLEAIKSKYSKAEQSFRPNIGSCILSLIETSDQYHDKEAISDIHQLLKHGVDYISGALSWLCYCLHKYPKVITILHLFDDYKRQNS